MLNFLSNRLQKTIKKIGAKTTLSEANIQTTLKELKIALLEADVNLLVIKKFIANIKQKAIGTKISESLNASQQLLTIVREELVQTLGKNVKELKIIEKPFVIMMIGLQGTGKTTSVAKVAWYLRKKKYIKKPLMIAADVYRPAAINQLITLGKQVKIDVFAKTSDDNPVEIVKEGIKFAKNNEYDLVLIDTAGRLAIDAPLMQELQNIKRVAKPKEIWLTVDALVGQDIINVAETFHEKVKLSGTLITKLDSDARAGACLSIASLLNIPTQFIGTGEAISDIDLFYPDRMTERILGMGDVFSLIEKAQDNIDEKKVKKVTHRMLSGRFDMNDLLEQLKQVKKMGKFSKLIAMIPGAQKISKEQINSAEKKLKLYEIIISSMTKEERSNPKLLKVASRKKRIINGSGRSNQDYNKLLNEFDMMQAKMKRMLQSIEKGNFDPSNFSNMGI